MFRRSFLKSVGGAAVLCTGTASAATEYEHRVADVSYDEAFSFPSNSLFILYWPGREEIHYLTESGSYPDETRNLKKTVCLSDHNDTWTDPIGWGVDSFYCCEDHHYWYYVQGEWPSDEYGWSSYEASLGDTVRFPTGSKMLEYYDGRVYYAWNRNASSWTSTDLLYCEVSPGETVSLPRVKQAVDGHWKRNGDLGFTYLA